MGKAGITQVPDTAAGNMAMDRARGVVDDLVGGRSVPAARVTEARDALIGGLARGPAAAAEARRGLVAIYERSADGADAAQTVGELYGAGSRGRAALQEILDSDARSALTRDDLRDLEASADRPVGERLALLLDKLDDASRHHPSRGGGPRPDAHEVPVADAATLPKEDRANRAGRVVDRQDDPPDGSLDDVRNTRLAPELRQSRALSAGRAAVPVLGGILRGKSDPEREFAVATLIHLGRTKGAAREVYQEMQRVEMSDPAARRAAELVRNAIDPRGGGGEAADLHARDRVRIASVHDGWLRAALESCDRPSILRAAAGREVLAISLGARRLHQLRAGEP
jgi:hypothetical protein